MISGKKHYSSRPLWKSGRSAFVRRKRWSGIEKTYLFIQNRILHIGLGLYYRLPALRHPTGPESVFRLSTVVPTKEYYRQSQLVPSCKNCSDFSNIIKLEINRLSNWRARLISPGIRFTFATRPGGGQNLKYPVVDVILERYSPSRY